MLDWVFDSFLGFMAVVLALTVAVIGGVLVVAVYLGESYDKNQCPKIGAAMHRPTKFVRYNYLSWDCLTPDNSGHWISTDNLRVVSNG